MNTITGYDEEDCSFDMNRNHSTVRVFVSKWSDLGNPYITVQLLSKNGQHLLVSRTWQVLCARSEDGSHELLKLRRSFLRVGGIGRHAGFRRGRGGFGDRVCDRSLWEALYEAGITDPDHCRGLDWWGIESELEPLNAAGWKFMRGATCAEVPEEPPVRRFLNV